MKLKQCLIIKSFLNCTVPLDIVITSVLFQFKDSFQFITCQLVDFQYCNIIVLKINMQLAYLMLNKIVTDLHYK